MQVTDVRSSFGDNLTVEFQHYPEHPVRSRMGRPHINRQLFTEKFGLVDGLQRLGCPGQRVRHFYFTRSGHRVGVGEVTFLLFGVASDLFVKNFTSNKNPSSFVLSRPATSTAGLIR